MVMPSANDVAAKWAQNTGSAVGRYQAGVKAVTVSPGQAAARSADLWLQKVTASKQKFAANAAKVSLADWQNAAAEKGGARLASGVQAAQPTYEQAMGKLLPFIASATSSLPQRGDLEANINRMTSFVRKMSTYNK